MVLKLIIIIGIVLIWILISPVFNSIGKFIIKRFENLFNDDEGEF